jgi:CRISPR/Cas system endoribonuclease Cas6 (RAMP superfamily)
MRCWNQFSDSRRFSKENMYAYKAWLQKNVGVSRYELQTRVGAVRKNQRTAGFTGTITYELGDKENPYNKTTHMLAQYAEYANTGGNKTAAYGQTKLAHSEFSIKNSR